MTTMMPEQVAPPMATTAVGLTDQAYEPERRSRVGWWVAALVLLALLGAAAAFILPGMFEKAPTEVQVPSLVNLTEDDARQTLGDAGLKVGDVTSEASQDIKKGRVIRQDPPKDDYVAPGSTVDFVVSTGKPTVQMPQVIGMSKQAAKRVLESAPYNFEVILREQESDDEAGQVVDTSPKPGRDATEGATVTVYYSDGPETVPDVVGKQEDVARQLLEAAGYTVKVVYDDSPTEEATGTVLEQNPTADSPLSQGSQVVLIVTSYVAPTESPSPSDTTSPSASSSP
jgi:serine/threonine-protein kinase